MEREKVEFWTFGFENGNIIINLDKNTKYIEVTPKDLKSVMSWVMMEQETYRSDWHKGLLKWPMKPLF